MNRILYHIEGMPILQNRTFDSEWEAINCQTGDVRLIQSHTTGLVYNDAFDPNLIDYDSRYQNEQALSSVFQDHLENVRDIISRHFTGKSLIEVGCGKGYFLEKLQKAGFQISGFDPVYQGCNPAIIKKYFSESFQIQSDALILRHVLEHIKNPVDFCISLLKANGGGLIYIEVPCLDWIIQNKAWFDIFYEHVNYFRVSDFYRLFDRVYESGHLFGGQYLYIVAELSSLRIQVHNTINDILFPRDFLNSVDELFQKLSIISRDSKLVIWGGSSKGVVFSLVMKRLGINIDAVVDINPKKWGTYLPVTGIRVCSPSELVPKLDKNSYIIIMNNNYLEEIVKETENEFNYLILST